MHVSAPAGSGKTFLLRSWIAAEGLSDRAAWVSVGRQEHDPQVFWLSVLDSLRQTGAGSERVRELTAAPDLDGANVVGRLLEDLSSLREPLWLVIDDLHELQADQAIRDMELLLGTAPPQLRFVLLTRRDLRLGLHRLRVEGELTEIRGEDLRFTLEESRALLEAAGVRLSDGALESLVATTEGWAAGLRLVALSLARHPDPERYAVSFSGRERAVADYLVAEVLERQSAEVRRLLLRTSLLERVSGPLADRLTGSSGSYGILAGLEDAGAFVVAVDPERTWFRYHHLFGDLLALELRRTAPQEVPGLHTIAAEWWAEHGYPVEAIRHAQAAENWGLAARLLADNWFGLYFDGRLATRRELLSGFPAGVVAADPELVVLAAGDKRAAGSLDESEWYLKRATGMAASVLEDRRGRFTIALGIQRLSLARARNDLRAVAEEAQRLLASTEATEFGLGEEVRTSVLTDLGIAEMWAGRLEDAERHLEQGLEEARRISRPMLELQALANSGAPERPFALSGDGGAARHAGDRAGPQARLGGDRTSGRDRVRRARRGDGLARAATRGRVVARPGRTRPRARHPTDPGADAVRDTGVVGGRAWPARGGGCSLSGCRADGEAACHAAHVHGARASAQAPDARPRGRDRTGGASPRGDGRRGSRNEPDAGRTRGSEISPRRSRGRRGRPRTPPRRLDPGHGVGVGNRGVAAGGDRARRAWRSRSGVARARARARRRRARRPAASVPALPDRGAAASARRDFGPLTPR